MNTDLSSHAPAAHTETLSKLLYGSAGVTHPVTAGLLVLVRVDGRSGVRVVRRDSGHGSRVCIDYVSVKFDRGGGSRWDRGERKYKRYVRLVVEESGRGSDESDGSNLKSVAVCGPS